MAEFFEETTEKFFLPDVLKTVKEHAALSEKSLEVLFFLINNGFFDRKLFPTSVSTRRIKEHYNYAL